MGSALRAENRTQLKKKVPPPAEVARMQLVFEKDA
jgi:hypothetical protein